MSRPVAASGTKDSAVCATVSAPESLRWTALEVIRFEEAARSPLAAGDRDPRSAGRSPERTPVRIESAAEQSRTRQSRVRILKLRNADWSETGKNAKACERDRESADAAKCAHQQAFGEQLANDSKAAGTEVGAERQLPSAICHAY